MRMPTKWQLILKNIEANHAVKDLQSFSQPFISTGVGPTLPFWLFEASDDVGNLSKVRFKVEFVWFAMIITHLASLISLWGSHGENDWTLIKKFDARQWICWSHYLRLWLCFWKGSCSGLKMLFWMLLEVGIKKIFLLIVQPCWPRENVDNNRS